MPYADAEQRRDYDRAYKRKLRAQVKTEKRFSKRQTASEIEIVDDVHGLLAIVADAVSLVRNDRQSTGVAKGRALAYIATIVARMLPLVEAAAAQAKDWEKIHREHDVMFEMFSRDPEAKQVVLDMADLQFRIEKEAARRCACEVERQGEF